MRDELKIYLEQLGFLEINEGFDFSAFCFDFNEKFGNGKKFGHIIYLVASFEEKLLNVDVVCFGKFKESIILEQQFEDFEGIKNLLEKNEFLQDLLSSNLEQAV